MLLKKHIFKMQYVLKRIFFLLFPGKGDTVVMKIAFAWQGLAVTLSVC